MNKLFKLVSDGVAVVIERRDGITERYKLASTKVMVTYSGKNVCLYCGHKLDPSTRCKCKREVEMLSLTGAFRHIDSVEARVGMSSFDPMKNTLKVVEV